jgi:acyl carrier protein
MGDLGGQTGPREWPAEVEPEMIDRFLDIISEKAKIDRSALVPNATMDSLNIPSLDMVDILFGVEEEFNIYIPMGDELSHVVYLHDLVKVLAEQAANSEAGEAQG